MARIPLKLDELIDGDALRRDLAALAAATATPAPPAVSAEALQLLKDRLAAGRRLAERC